MGAQRFKIKDVSTSVHALIERLESEVLIDLSKTKREEGDFIEDYLLDLMIKEIQDIPPKETILALSYLLGRDLLTKMIFNAKHERRIK